MRQLPPPSDFGHDHRDIWSAAQKQLRAQGTWTKTDAPLLEAYVRNVVLGRTARIEADRWGFEQSNMGQMRASAHLKVAAEAEAAAYRFATALLLTPESRRRHGIKSAPNAKDAEGELNALVG